MCGPVFPVCALEFRLLMIFNTQAAEPKNVEDCISFRCSRESAGVDLDNRARAANCKR